MQISNQSSTNSSSPNKQANTPKRLLVSVLLVGALGLSSTASLAASQCKGLTNNLCTSNNSCSWVEGYERKDGRSVKSFCRTKSANLKNRSSKPKTDTSSKK